MTAPEQPQGSAGARTTFPTAGRTHLSAGNAYPLGARDLSDALSRAPQSTLLSCTFSSSRSLSARRRSKIKLQYRGEVIEPPVYRVLSVAYRRRERSIFSGEHAEQRRAFDPSWKITVFAVPSTLRHAIRERLLEHGLPKIALPWLLNHEAATGLIGACELSLRYDADKGSLLSIETDTLQPASQ